MLGMDCRALDSLHKNFQSITANRLLKEMGWGRQGQMGL